VSILTSIGLRGKGETLFRGVSSFLQTCDGKLFEDQIIECFHNELENYPRDIRGKFIYKSTLVSPSRPNFYYLSLIYYREGSNFIKVKQNKGFVYLGLRDF
jgi:hypothetical protein